MSKLNKITTYPIGLGMGNLELETSAAYCWNYILDNELPLDSYLPLEIGEQFGMFNIHPNSGFSLENLGMIEVKEDLFCFTPKALELLIDFTKE